MLLFVMQGCAMGDDGIVPRGGDAGATSTDASPDMDAQSAEDAQVVDGGSDAQVAPDSGDAQCVGTRECVPGATEVGATCGNCGQLVRMCGSDCRYLGWQCLDEGECQEGSEEVETRDCPGDCGFTQSRRRVCSTACVQGSLSAWSTCQACPVDMCGDTTCNGDETCESCADCQNNHMGAGDSGDDCSGVPENTWRCATTSSGQITSQHCRSGVWGIFNLNPRDCAACVCSFSNACSAL